MCQLNIGAKGESYTAGEMVSPGPQMSLLAKSSSGEMVDPRSPNVSLCEELQQRDGFPQVPKCPSMRRAPGERWLPPGLLMSLYVKSSRGEMVSPRSPNVPLCEELQRRDD